MPRVTNHISQGRSQNPMQCCKCTSQIVKGERYYQWAIKAQRGGTVYRQHESHGRPKQSQLTHSKMSDVYAAIESAEEAIASSGCCSDVAEALRGAASDIESVRDDYQSSLDNMPEGLQQGDTGQQIEERVSNLDDFVQALNDAADECESMEEEPEEGEDGEEPEGDNGLEAAQDRANEALGELDE